MHIFEVIDEGRYTYCGRIELVYKPYTETQPGEEGIDHLVWTFPILPVPENDAKKSSIFVFKDWTDYQKNRNNLYAKYNADHKVETSKKSSGKSVQKFGTRSLEKEPRFRKRVSI